MRPEDQTPDYKALGAQKLYDAVLTVVCKTKSHLTPNQQMRLAKYVAEESPDFADARSGRGAWTPSEADIVAHVEALAYLKLPDAEVYRTPPSVGDVERAIVKAENITSPTDRMTLHRELVRLSPDELLARSKGLDLSAAAATETPKQTAAPKNTEKVAFQMSDRELFTLVGQTVGRDPHSLLPSKIREIGAALVEASRPKQTPALDALRSKLQNQSWHAVPSIEKITAERESKDVLGKSLQQLGLGPK